MAMHRLTKETARRSKNPGRHWAPKARPAWLRKATPVVLGLAMTLGFGALAWTQRAEVETVATTSVVPTLADPTVLETPVSTDEVVLTSLPTSSGGAATSGGQFIVTTTNSSTRGSTAPAGARVVSTSVTPASALCVYVLDNGQ